MNKIYVTQEDFVIVDDEDYVYLNQWKWKLNNSGYARRTKTISQGGRGKKKKFKTIYLHRELLNPPINFEIDHINRDKRDNRRCNLRLVSRSQNLHNVRFNKRNTSGYRGISWNKKANKWQVKIQVNNVTKWLGLYTDIEKARKVLGHNRAYCA